MRKFAGILALASLTLWGQAAFAAWPGDKPIELVVGFAPGGGTDNMARLLARFVEKRLGNGAKIVVVNKPGSAGELAATYVQRAKPDGYTLGIVNVPGYVFLPMYRKTAYQPENIRLLARVVDDPAMLVANKEAGKPLTMKALVEAAKKAPDGFSVGHAGEGTTGHLGLLELGRQTGIKLNSIPFKGASEAKTALLGGHVDYVAITTGEALDVSQPGSKLTGVAVWSGKRAANQVPTAAEQGYDLRISSERGVAAPRALPDSVARSLEEAIAQALKDPAFVEAAKADAPVLAFLPGAEWEQHLQELRVRLKPLVGLMGTAK
ncbi:MAG: tripartite tricarboxylate transporter substrate binding protein [Acidovorax sp.]